MRQRRRIAICLATTVISLSGCGEFHRPHYAIVAVGTSPAEPKWVRLDTDTGDMIVCGLTAPPSTTVSVPPPPPGFVVDHGYYCGAATAGKVINWNDLK